MAIATIFHFSDSLANELNLVTEITELVVEVEIKKMENTAMLKDWFERVDSEKTGTITAPQLKVLLLQSPFCLFQFPKIPLSSLSFALRNKTTTFDLFPNSIRALSPSETSNSLSPSSSK